VALTRESEKRTRVTDVARAVHVIEMEKGERKSAREWSEITTGLQKQLGGEQKRVVELQKQGTRADRAYQLRTAALEEKLGAEHAARLREQDDYKVATLVVVPRFPIYDLFPFRLLYPVHKVTLLMVDKLKQSKKEANHKLRNLRQRLGVQPEFRVVDLSEIDGPEVGTDEDMRAELALLKAQLGVENARLRRLVCGAGKGRPKSPEFEFASRTILATGKPKPQPANSNYHNLTAFSQLLGCSARAARDQILVAAQLFLNEENFCEFEVEVPNERWFRHQRKGLGYEAWLYAMIRVAKC
jgi:hypothetical protein